MHNIKDIRKDIEFYKKKLSHRNYLLDADDLILIDKQNRELIQKKELLEQEKKNLSKSKNKENFTKSKLLSQEIEKFRMQHPRHPEIQALLAFTVAQLIRRADLHKNAKQFESAEQDYQLAKKWGVSVEILQRKRIELKTAQANTLIGNNKLEKIQKFLGMNRSMKAKNLKLMNLWALTQNIISKPVKMESLYLRKNLTKLQIKEE